MISNTLLNKFILKYASDVNDATNKEWYEACKGDPDCYARMRTEDNKRNKAYHDRQRENPSEAFVNRQRGKSQSLKALKESGSLDGIAKLMSTSIASYTSELKKAIIREMRRASPPGELDPTKIVEHPLINQWKKDSSELYYLRDKIKEAAESLHFISEERPFQRSDVLHLIDVIGLCDNYLTTFKGKYPSILKHVVSAVQKMNDIMGG